MHNVIPSLIVLLAMIFPGTVSPDWDQFSDIHKQNPVVSVQAVQARNAVSFKAHIPQAIPNMSIEVFSLSGERIFHGLSEGNGIMWDLRDARGRKVPNGIYYYRMTAVDYGGSYHWGALKKFIVLR